MKAKVLVVEDSREQRAHLVGLLVAQGYEVATAAGGFEAIQAAKASPPQVVLLDVQLDDIDGHSICRWLRFHEATKEVAIIMLTVRNHVKERVAGLLLGADDYLPKPYENEELLARIHAVLRASAARRELRQRNAELEGMLNRTEQLAMTDALTGILNRRRLMDVLRREWATARRYGHPLSCALVDVDHFKQVNDQLGHGAGDETLRSVATILSSSIREVDVCARYGGDEFCVLLPHTTVDNAKLVLERIRAKLHAARAAWTAPASNISLSLGVASSQDSAIETPEALLECADRGLYEAKRLGRDRVIAAPSVPSLRPPIDEPHTR